MHETLPTKWRIKMSVNKGSNFLVKAENGEARTWVWGFYLQRKLRYVTSLYFSATVSPDHHTAKI